LVGHLTMLPGYYHPHRNGDYVYDVIVTKDEAQRLSRRYCATLSNAERIENGRLASVPVDVADAYGPTVSEAMRALDEHFAACVGRIPLQGCLDRRPVECRTDRNPRSGSGGPARIVRRASIE
jgi:hypothetical protein